MTPEALRAAMADNPKMRPRDLADHLGVGEAALVAARGAVPIAAHPDRVMPYLCTVGEVMALTRNPSVVHEKVGVYGNYHPGTHAAMIVNDAIDLRMFPSRWVHGFAIEGERRSVQLFDAAGDAVHKVFARDGTDQAAWDRMVTELTVAPGPLALTEREPPEPPKSAPDRGDVLRDEWARMTDTHQFLRLVSKLKMNRLGAYRIAGAPFVRALAPGAFDLALHRLAGSGLHVMLFVGNRGCIQIHSGPLETLKPMGPWQNVLDPGFNLHLRLDHIAEVWAVDKPTKRGMARSIECFDAQGALIAQMFAVRKEDRDDAPGFAAVIDALPDMEKE